ncbi:MAG: exosortase/archaeosortase family protein [Candidatus Aenigmatarchaeota archaeon]
MRRLNRKQAKLWVITVFLARVAMFSLPLYFILWINPSFAFLQYAVRDNVVYLSNAAGIEINVDGFDLNLNTINGPMIINIAEDCTGWKAVLAYVALVFAVPGTENRKRLIGLAGVPVIYAINVARIVFLVLVASNMGLGDFRLFHELLLKLGMSAAIFGAWYIWMAKTEVKIKAERFAAPFQFKR